MQIDITTDRLTLGELVEADVPVLVDSFNNEKIKKGLNNVPPTFTEQMAHWMIQGQFPNRNNRVQYLFAIRVKDSDELIGCVSLHKFNGGEVEIGYWIAEKHWGNNYASESTLGAIKYAFKELGMKEVCGIHAKENEASGRVMAKCGMTKRSTLGHHILYQIINQSC